MEKKIALSIEQMKKLESLGLDTSDASLYYNKFLSPAYAIRLCQNSKYVYKGDESFVSYAYTLQDILEKINLIDFVYNNCVVFIEVNLYKYTDGYRCCLMFDKIPKHETNGISILEASYQMLLWCIENNYIKIK